jgi:hypothetical protein
MKARGSIKAYVINTLPPLQQTKPADKEIKLQPYVCVVVCKI